MRRSSNLSARRSLLVLGTRAVGRRSFKMASVTVVMIADVFVFGFLSLFSAFFNDLDVVIEDGGYDGDHVGLDDSGSNGLGASNADIDDALES